MRINNDLKSCKKLKHLGLFEGIGGFSLAARWAGWETVAWCEWNKFGQKVLRHHFPEAEGFGDITKTDFRKYANKIDILTGGFPCQPYSLAGKRKGKEDDRHLWPEMLRAIREIRPPYVVGENVFGLINWNRGLVFNEVQADLEAEGYEVWAYVLPACAVNAPHRRDRVWFVAYSRHNSTRKAGNSTGNERQEFATIHTEGQSRKCKTIFNSGLCNLQGTDTNTDCNGCDQCDCNNEKHASEGGINALGNIGTGGEHGLTADTGHKRLERSAEFGGIRGSGKERNKQPAGRVRTDWQNFPTQSPICGGDDGLPNELDGITFSKWRNESIKAYGNAIVPQVAFEIFKAINEMP
jgi:DNA (cytosine-5)-methyltransferase 1